MSPQPYYVFVKPGDARPELEELLEHLAEGAAEAVGYHKSIFVTQANQTVVFVTGREVPLAGALRGREGWQEPEQ